MKMLTFKLVGAAAGILFAGAGSAAAYPLLGTHLASSSSAAGSGSSASAQVAVDADLSSAQSALQHAGSLADSGSSSSTSSALSLYSTAAHALSDAATQAGALASTGSAAGSAALLKVATTINGVVDSLSATTAAGIDTAVGAASDVSSALDQAASAAQTAASTTRTQVLGLVSQGRTDLHNLVALTPGTGGAGSAPPPASAPSGQGLSVTAGLSGSVAGSSGSGWVSLTGAA